jgi:hypothetical protein
MKLWKLSFEFEQTAGWGVLVKVDHEASLTQKIAELALSPLRFDRPRRGQYGEPQEYIQVVFEFQTDQEWDAQQEAARIASKLATIKPLRIVQTSCIMLRVSVNRGYPQQRSCF